jgi:hypothetical protein
VKRLMCDTLSVCDTFACAPPSEYSRLAAGETGVDLRNCDVLGEKWAGSDLRSLAALCPSTPSRTSAFGTKAPPRALYQSKPRLENRTRCKMGGIASRRRWRWLTSGMLQWLMVDRRAAPTTALCSTVVPASHAGSPAHSRARCMPAHHLRQRVRFRLPLSPRCSLFRRARAAGASFLPRMGRCLRRQ